MTEALRLSFRYEGADVQLVDRQPVNQFVLPSEEIEEAGDRAGFWYELRDANDAPVYRRTIGNPIAYEAEITGDEPDSPMVRLPIPPAGDFSLLVPIIDGAATLALVSSPLDQERDGEPARDLARFNLTGGGPIA